MGNVHQPFASLIREMEAEDNLIQAIDNFNTTPTLGVQQLLEVLNFDDSPRRVAHALHTTPSLSPDSVGEFLAERDHAQFTVAFFDELDLKCSLLDAMRKSFRGVSLPRDESARNRLLTIFSVVYCNQNGPKYPSSDITTLIAYSILLLSCDISTARTTGGEHMTLQHFIESVRAGINETVSSDAELTEIYTSLAAEPLCFSRKGDEFRGPKLRGWLKKKPGSAAAQWKKRYFVMTNAHLYYFESEDVTRHPLGKISLHDVSVSFRDNMEFAISKKPNLNYVKYRNGKTTEVKNISQFKFAVGSERSCMKWFYRLKQSVVCAKLSNPTWVQDQDDEFGNEISDIE